MMKSRYVKNSRVLVVRQLSEGDHVMVEVRGITFTELKSADYGSEWII